ncbi:hypothetical protein PRUPE_7G091800 [Prunus persica]|uniref:Uncharacterized protein n=1 Tax=Prunus persica TaxID=3760 RepID=M5WB73_PRUPE|nr:hypothetical protein PRUPE_7G091800 [Prunus persica]
MSIPTTSTQSSTSRRSSSTKACSPLSARDGTGIGQPPPKSGHGGKYKWEGPDDVAENEMDPVPPAIDEGDPNYVDEVAEERIVKGEDADVAGLVVGKVEVAKATENREGVARVEVVTPHNHLES